MFGLGLKKKLSLANDNLRAHFHRFVDCHIDSSRMVLDTPSSSSSFHSSLPSTCASSSSSSSSTASAPRSGKDRPSLSPFTPFSSLSSLPLAGRDRRYGRLDDNDEEESVFAEWEAAEVERAAVIEKEARTRQMLAEALGAPRKAGSVLGLPAQRHSVYEDGMRAPRKAASVLGLSSVGEDKSRKRASTLGPPPRTVGEGDGEDDPFR